MNKILNPNSLYLIENY